MAVTQAHFNAGTLKASYVAANNKAQTIIGQCAVCDYPFVIEATFAGVTKCAGGDNVNGTYELVLTQSTATVCSWFKDITVDGNPVRIQYSVSVNLDNSQLVMVNWIADPDERYFLDTQALCATSFTNDNVEGDCGAVVKAWGGTGVVDVSL